MGYLDAKKEWLMLFISWIGKQDLKRYDAVGLVNLQDSHSMRNC